MSDPDYAGQVRDAFPGLDEIGDDDLRERTRALWADALAESAYDDLAAVPWWPAYEEFVGEQRQVDHVRDVVACAVALADAVTGRRAVDLDRDLIVAGALVHDVSKLFETTPEGIAAFNDLLPHPHFAVHLLEAAGFSREMQHLVLAHSARTGVEPKTIEAEVVKTADEMAAHALFWEASGRLKTVTR